MKPETLREVKEQITTFTQATNRLLTYFESPKFKTIGVLLQNLGFEGAGTINYSHEKEVKKCEDIIAILKDMAYYEQQCNVTMYIYQEIDFIWNGYNMAEEFA